MSKNFLKHWVNNMKFKKIHKIGVALIFLILVVASWHFYNETLYFHKPDYKKEDISSLLTKESLCENDYIKIFKQTGVSPGAAKELIDNGNETLLNELHNLYFEPPKYYKNYIAYPFTLQERNKNQITPLVNLKKGDILITFNTLTVEWRHGHCGLVLDKEGTTLLEHAAIGQTSGVNSSAEWGKYPGFVVLRYPDSEVASKAADYATQNLMDIPYSITAGVLDKDKTGEENPSSHCSHIVWQAYKSVGVDIDRDRSFIVSPKDVAMSEKLEVVQIFGMDTDDYIKRLYMGEIK